MRERLLAALVGLTLLTVLLYGVPRAVVRADIVTEEARADVTRSAEVVAEIVNTRNAAGLPLDDVALGFLDPGDQVLYRDGDDVQRLAGPASASGGPSATADVAGGGVVEVRRASSTVREDVLGALRPILLTGLVALAVAVVVAVLLSARLARPFQLLAGGATALGRGDFDADLPPQRVREAEAIADALRTSSERVARMLAREREFARNASHQLRTPLTGIRLRVEDLSAWPETAPEVRAELAHVLEEVDRLADTVTSLLAFARDERLSAWEEVPLDTVVTAAAERWRALAADRGRRVDVSAPSAVVPVPRVAVDQVLDVLVDNALKHGMGAVSVRATADAARVRFVVEDEGQSPPTAGSRGLPRRAEGSAEGGEGIGLRLCADLAESLGGRLAMTGTGSTAFELELPHRPAAG